MTPPSTLGFFLAALITVLLGPSLGTGLRGQDGSPAAGRGRQEQGGQGVGGATQGVPPGPPAETGGSEEGPVDPALRKSYDALVAQIRALERPGAAEREATARRVEELAEKLTGPDQKWAGVLHTTWGSCLHDQASAFLEAERAYSRANDIFDHLGDGWRHARLHRLRGMNLFSLGRNSEALAEVETAERLLREIGSGNQLRIDREYGEIANCRGDVFRSQRRDEEALAQYEIAAEFFKKVGDERALADANLSRARMFSSSRKYAEALAAFEQAAAVFERLGDRSGLASVAQARGIVFKNLREYERALAEYERAAKIYEAACDESALATIQQNQGVVQSYLGRHEDALALYAKAAAVFRRTGDRRNLARVTHSRGIDLDQLDRFEEALAAYAEARDLYAMLGDRRNAAQVTGARVEILARLGRQEEAIVEFDSAEGILARPGEEDGLASIIEMRGMLHKNLNQPEKALFHLSRAEGLYTKLGDTTGVARIDNLRGSVLLQLGRYDDALALYQQAAKVFDQLGDTFNAGVVTMNRGIALAMTGRYEDALPEYEKAERTYRQSGDAPGLANALANRAYALSNLGRLEEALALDESAARIFKESGRDHSWALAIQDRGNILRLSKRPEEALSHFEQAGEVFQAYGDTHQLAKIAHDRGGLFRDLGRYSESLAEYRKAAALVVDVLNSQVQPLGSESSLRYRSLFHRMLSGALDSYARLAEKGMGNPDDAHQVIELFQGMGVAEILAERGRLQAAGVPEDLRADYTDLQNRLRAAQSKRAQLATARPPTGLRARGERLESLRRAKDDVAILQKQLDGLRERIRVLNREYAAVVYPRPASLSQVQSLLPRGTVLVEFAIDKEAAYAFVITSGMVQVHRLGTAADLEEEVRRAVASLGREGDASPPAKAGEALRALGKEVLDPVLAALPRTEGMWTLLISPAGILCRVPFEALLLADVGASTPPSEWPFLVTKYDVSYVHSGTVYREQTLLGQERRKKEGLPRFVGFGNPQYPRAIEDRPETAPPASRGEELAGFRPLPGSGLEVLRIGQLFTEGDGEYRRLEEAASSLEKDPGSEGVAGYLTGRRFAIFLGAAASEAALKSRPEVKEATVLHIACHGEADLTMPSLSHLVLSQSAQLAKGAEEDGYLSLTELRDLGIQAELLVLSACETNAGLLRPFEGIAGLARAGIAGGAGSVISTLWKVEDKAARDLMVSFYAAWLRDHRTKIRALSEAKRGAIRAGRPVRTWSAFILWDPGL